METNVVTLELEEYNRLRDFEKDVNDYKTIIIETTKWDYCKKIITESEAVKIVANINVKLQEENNVLKDEVEYLKNYNFDQFRYMSIWEFLKWRKTI